MIESVANLISNHVPETVIVVLLFLSGFLEISKIKINPWSWLGKKLLTAASKIGNAINAPVMAKLGDIEVRITVLEATNDRQDAERAMDKALDARRRILQFADEIRRGTRHSQEHFNNVLENIKYYEDYCHRHEEFKNDKAVISIKIIRETYEKCERENDFL